MLSIFYSTLYSILSIPCSTLSTLFTITSTPYPLNLLSQ